MQINQADPETIQDHKLGVPQRDDSKRFKCGDCDFQTAYSGSLKVHSRKHTGEMLQCQHCDYTTVHSRNLKVHSRKHMLCVDKLTKKSNIVDVCAPNVSGIGRQENGKVEKYQNLKNDMSDS